jgi:hypothetical protein
MSYALRMWVWLTSIGVNQAAKNFLIAERAAVSNLVQRLQLPGFLPTQREEKLLDSARFDAQAQHARAKAFLAGYGIDLDLDEEREKEGKKRRDGGLRGDDGAEIAM